MKEFFQKIEIRNVLGVIIVVGSFLLLYLMLNKEIPGNNKDVVNTAIGFVMGGALSSAAMYFFGDSKKNNFPPNTPPLN